MAEPKRAVPASGDAPIGDATEEPRRVASLRFRWAMLWTALGALIPGLGLWHAGRRVVGSVVMGAFAALLVAAIYFATAGRSRLTTLGTDVGVLNGVAVGMLVLAVVWVAVIAASHLALRPPRPSVPQRAVGGLLVGVLAFAVAAPLAIGAEYTRAYAGFVGTVFADEPMAPEESPTPGQPTPTDPWANKPRLNVLIIGGDSGTDRDPTLGLRADAVMMASIDTRTGVTTLFSLPRQTARVPFPADSPLSRYYPNGFFDGYDGANPEYFLNAMYNNVPMRIPKDLLGNVRNLGAEVMKIGVGEALGLGKADYYVIVDMDGFKEFINALGGITLNINYRIPVGGQTTEGIPPERWIEPGPDQHLNGRDALWYARGRYGVEGSDYSRMERQRCVINAVVQQAQPQNVLANFNKIAAAGSKTIQTDIPRRMLPHLIDLALKVKDTNLHSVVFKPGVAGWVSSNPPWDKVRKRVQGALKEADAKESPKPSTSPSASTSTTKPKPSASATPGKSEDLSDSCAYHPVQ